MRTVRPRPEFDHRQHKLADLEIAAGVSGSGVLLGEDSVDLQQPASRWISEPWQQVP